MMKFKQSRADSQIRPELVQIIHDKVISLCQMEYASFEVDGIICITLLDTKEQQVVKIHKTLKSVKADTVKSTTRSKAKNNVYPSITAILTSSDNRAHDNGTEHLNFSEQIPAEQQSYQKDINILSDLLKESNEINKLENNEKVHVEEPKKNKRKRKRSKHMPENVEEAGEPAEETNEVTDPCYDKYTDTVIIVKEEPIDNEYDIRLVDPNTCQDSQEQRMSIETSAHELETTEMNSKIQNENSNNKDTANTCIGDVNGDSPSEDVSIPASKQTDAALKKTTETNGNDPVKDGEDLFAQFFAGENDQNKLPEGVQQKHSEWLYQLAKKSLQDSGNNSGSDSGSSDTVQSTARKGFGMPRERGRQEPDPLGRSWFEMIKSNASKYQAALMRSGNKGKGLDEFPKPSANSNFEQLRDLLKERKAQMETVVDKGGKEPVLNDSVKLTEDSNSIGSEDNSESKELSVDGVSESDKSRSISPAPVVKIEVDEQVPLNFGQSLHEVSGNDHGITPPPVSVAAPKAQGKLVSRYPALFNQLQTKRDVAQSTDQNDSLLNRLPFISFQELFSPSGPSGSKVAPTMPAATSQTLPETTTKPSQPKSNNLKKTRTVWNWKKRAVRPKDKYGNIIDYLPAGATVSGQMGSPSKPSKKKHKLDDEEQDTDWTPSSDKKVRFKASVKDSPGGRLSTRLSTGDRPKMNFTEVEVSDTDEDFEGPEIKEETMEEANADNIELVSAYCRYQCGGRFETFGELAEHEHVCESNVSDLPESSENCHLVEIDTAEECDQTEESGEVEESGQMDEGGQAEESSQIDECVSGQTEEGTVKKTGHKCSICGLDFNQQYRWQYHMVKVHGVSVTTDHLFR